MKTYILILAACASLAAVSARADDTERDERYRSFLSCAAFHTIEASKSSGNAVDAQRAVALDYAQAATAFAPDGKGDTANTDLQQLLGDFQKELDEGDPREMAAQWTDLESACDELHQLKDEWAPPRKETPSAAEAR